MGALRSIRTRWRQAGVSCGCIRVKCLEGKGSRSGTYETLGFERQNQHSPAEVKFRVFFRNATDKTLTSDLSRWRSSLPPMLVVLLRCDRTVMYKMPIASTSSTNISWRRLPATSISKGMFFWTVSNEVPGLRGGSLSCNFVEIEEFLTVLHFLQMYPSGGFARSGQSVMKCCVGGY